MRITESRLRKIIREALGAPEVDEGWGGHLGIVRSKKPAKEFRGGAGGQFKPNPDAAEKFARSEKFAVAATKLYANVPYTIYTLPFIGNIEDPEMQKAAGDRTTFPRRDMFPLSEEILENLRSVGYAVPKSTKSTKGSKGIDLAKDLLILYSTAGAEGKNAGSPWNIFHAIFNVDFNENELLKISPTFLDLVKLYYYPDDTDPVNKVAQIEEGWPSYLTMGSARTKLLADNYLEAAAEALVQELITRDRLNFGEAVYEEPEDVQESFRAFKQRIEICAEEARKNMQGNLIVVDVA